MPRPRLLPCERFQTVEVEVGEDVEHLSYDEGASIEWRAGRSPSARAMAAMCSGVLPQQPPAMLIKPLWGKLFR